MDKNKKILIVDDDCEVSESVRVALEAEGHKVVVCHDGEQGLIQAGKLNPDLIILDMMMPKRNGLLVLETLRRANPYPVRVILITANEGQRHKDYAKNLGVDDYIYKPFPMDLLLKAVQNTLEK